MSSKLLQNRKISIGLYGGKLSYLSPSLSDLYSKIYLCFKRPCLSVELMNSVAETLQKFGQEGVEDILRDILKNEYLLDAVSAVSYLQGNGFYKIVLLKENEFRIRLHIWMPGVFSQENLHTHRWYFASSIIIGKLLSEIWQDSAAPFASFYDEYLYLGKEKDPSIIGKAKVELVEKVSYQAGDAYVLPPHVLHRVISHGDGVTATLMCRPTGGKKWSRNISINNIPPMVQPKYLSSNELAKILNNYLDAATLRP